MGIHLRYHRLASSSRLTAEAQQAAKVPRIGLLGNNASASPHLLEAFLQGLRDLGYVDGRNVVIEYRFAEGKFERFPALAAELVALSGPQLAQDARGQTA